MSGSTIDAEERDLRERLLRARRQRLDTFPRDGLLWLVVPPLWPEAIALTQLPTGTEPVAEFLRRAVAAGICECSVGRDGVRYAATVAGRADVLAGSVNEAVHILRHIVTIFPPTAVPPPALARWLELVGSLFVTKSTFSSSSTHATLSTSSASSTSSIHLDAPAELIHHHIGALLKAGDTGTAMAWLDTGALLAQVIGGRLEAAVRIGNRRLELAYRRTHDARHLEHFLERRDQIAAFDALLGGPDDCWALHYLGAGGVGKTMLLRFLCRHAQGPVSRTDFDYISPDYPLRRPGQLLLELADDLRSFASDERQESLFQVFAELARDLHDALAGEPPASDPLANLHRHEFDKLLRAFADCLRALPQPVVLILDTCEELAKLNPTGSFQPGVAATFEIIERLHDSLPSLRVVFSGRRPLAPAGAGWRLGDGARAGRIGVLPNERPYLLLHEIRGFDRDEAERYLSEIAKLNLAEDLRAAVLARSGEATGGCDIVRTGQLAGAVDGKADAHGIQ